MPKNPLIRMLFLNWLIGAAAALLMLAGLFATNAAHLRDLIATSDSPILTSVLLLAGLLVTFCSVAMGGAIMTMGDNRDDGRGGRGAEAHDHAYAKLVPIRIKSRR
jgi:hypothetical protein